jgi:type I restriction enzyme R subunit
MSQFAFLQAEFADIFHPDVTDGTIADTLAKRLFSARVELVGEVDGDGSATSTTDGYVQEPTPHGHMGEAGSGPDRVAEIKKLRDGLAAELRTEISGMSLDNFLVRPQRRYVEKYSSKEAWVKVDADARHELIDHVAGLPSAVVDDDFEAKQFYLVVFRAELALLRVDPAFQGLRARITEIASLLEELDNIPMVAAEMALILEIQTDEFWQDITLPMLETVRRRLRALVKLIEYKKRLLVYSDFEDRAGVGTDITVLGIPVGTDVDAFGARRAYFSSRTRTTSLCSS